MGSPLDEQRAANARARAAAIIQADPEAASHLLKSGLASQKTILTLPYWSTIRLAAARTGAGPFTFTVAAGVRKAFATKVGGSGVIAGFPSTWTVDEADTNLNNENVTRNNETIEIQGISAELDPNAPVSLVKWAFRYLAMSISMGSDSTPPLGRLAYFAQGGGMHGQAADPLQLPGLQDATYVHGAVTNGNPQAGNFFRLPVPILWRGQDQGADTSFNINCDLKRAFTVTTADRALAAGIAAYTSPADLALGTYLDITWRLHGVRKNQRSSNV